MKIYRSLDEFERLDNAIVTSGTFDGVHVGHQKILQRLKEIADKNGGETVLLTYWPHPRVVLYPEERNLQLLNSIEEKAQYLRHFGIQHFVVIPFTKEFASLSSDEFIEKILIQKIGTKRLVIGYNHKFGKNRSGSFAELKKNGPKYGFEVEEIPKQDIDDIGVSSTKIREALAQGNVNIANKYLDRPYQLMGTVVEGDKLGRKIGYPTANIHVDFDLKLIPADGIYAVQVVYENMTYHGMLNIGYRPTVQGTKKQVEVHIIDFDKMIYNQRIAVKFIEKLRDEKKFDDLGQLSRQLGEDKKLAIRILNNL